MSWLYWSKVRFPFPSGQFPIDGFAEPFHRDRNENGGGTLIFVRDDIPSTEIKVKIKTN